MKQLLLVVAAALALGAMPQTAQRNPPPKLTPLFERTAVHAGTTVKLALQVELAENLHAQSNKPRDPSLRPTRLTIDAPAGVTVTEIVFPKPTEIRLPGYNDLVEVFERQFTIGAQVTLASSVPKGPLALPAHLYYQACDDKACYIPKTVDTIFATVVEPSSTTLPAVFHPDVFKAIAFGTGEKPAPLAPDAGTGSRVPPETSGNRPPGSISLNDFAVQGAPEGGYMTSAAFLQFLHNAETDTKPKGAFEDRGPLAILALVFVGGLALNLTPCVLPMIPINLAIIGAGAGANKKSRGLVLGGVYGGAMALVYGVLGLIVILTAGTFGGINASPWFNAGIAVLFVVLGLAMFDIGAIDLSRWSSGIRFDSNSRGTLVLAFSMGAVAALLAGACVAPVVIQVVFFASNLYAGGNASALALPFVLGLGMALPWPIAGAGLAALPKPGKWMNRVKYVFGVFILGTAVYYGYEAYTIFANRWVDPSSVRASVDDQLKAGWHASLDEGLAEAKRDNKLVLIDMWATWCKNCLTMDRTTLADPAVQKALEGYVKIKFQAEDLERAPAKDLASRFDVVGLPTYIVLKKK